MPIVKASRSRTEPGHASSSSRIGYEVWFPLGVYATTRLIDLILIVTAARNQVDGSDGRSYSSWASNWDGRWYQRIASHGYPNVIPRDITGHALQNEWGFYPVYPSVVGAVMRVSGLGFMAVAPTLSVILGAAAVLVMYRLVSQTAGRFTASATVVLTCTYMAAPAMQIAYTESLALLLVCTSLLLLRHHRYGWLVPTLVTLALTRAVALALVPVLVVHGISRYRRRRVEPFPASDRWRVAALACLGLVGTCLWPAIAALRTGDLMAYTETMSSWGKTGQLPVLIEFPLFAWVEGGALGLAVLLAVVALVATVALRNGASAWGLEVRAWAGFYPLYLLLATAPGGSNVRHMLLAFPLIWPFPEGPDSTADHRLRLAVVAILAICGLLLQWLWISQFLVPGGPTIGRPLP